MDKGKLLDKSEEICDYLCEKQEKYPYSQAFINQILINFLRKFIPKEELQKSNLFDYLNYSKKYYEKEISLETLLLKRKKLWDLFDKATGNFRVFVNLIVYTMYDLKAENRKFDDDDLYEIIANIVLDLNKIDESFPNKFISLFGLTVNE